MHILLIDNYDSFTYNLVQLLRESGVKHRLHIVKNTLTSDDLPTEADKVLISPGPGLPEESGNLMAMIAHPGYLSGASGFGLAFWCQDETIATGFSRS
jgi:anthranilate/para-aminobenzoate synthase component II